MAAEGHGARVELRSWCEMRVERLLLLLLMLLELLAAVCAPDLVLHNLTGKRNRHRRELLLLLLLCDAIRGDKHRPVRGHDLDV